MHNQTQHRPSENALLLNAMLETARDSSWQENLQHAVEAQEYFMIPGRKGGETSQVMQRIQAKRNDLQMKQDEKRKLEKEDAERWGR
jgi:hypothetical protein